MDVQHIYKGKRILVTGASGYIASTLIESLSKMPCQIVRMSRQKDLPGVKDPMAEVTDLCGDIRERAIWEEALPGTDFIFHLAAQTDIALSEEDSYTDFNCNVLPLIHLLNICREKSYAPTILFAGSTTISGLPEKLPVNESHRDDPLTPYCLHKLTAEKYLKDYVRLGVVKGAVLRLTNVYGPSANPSKNARGVLNKMILRAKEGEALFLYGSPDRLRDYIFIQDVVAAFLLAGACIEQLSGNHFIVGTGKGHSLEESFRTVIAQTESICGKKIELKYRDQTGEIPTVEQRNFIGDAAAFSSKTGWKPEYVFTEGVGITLKSFISNDSVT